MLAGSAVSRGVSRESCSQLGGQGCLLMEEGAGSRQPHPTLQFREDTGPSQRRSDFSVAQAIVRPEAILAAFWTSLQGELVTASKAIIEKEYQPHVIVSTTGPNPFNTLTDRELEEYRREVERKQKGPEESLDETGEQKEKSPPEPREGVPRSEEHTSDTQVQLEEVTAPRVCCAFTPRSQVTGSDHSFLLARLLSEAHEGSVL
ncbi:hypothetical protein CB1_000117020 [Camelus ferus]|nr:hypothetical protein CB1_000117020 [Camelus ferus]